MQRMEAEVFRPYATMNGFLQICTRVSTLFSGIVLSIEKIFRNFALGTTSFLLMTTEAMTKKIAEYFKTQPVLKAWLFGSYSRGEERPDSDVDILVTYDRSKPIGLFKIAGMHLDLEKLLDKEVDLVEEKMLFPWVSEHVNNDKKLIYERAY